jgi:hypothetical protein
MNAARSTTAGVGSVPARYALAYAASGMLLIIALVFPSGLAGAYGTAGPSPAWSNGVITVNFTSGTPAVILSPNSDTWYGMYVGVGTISEVGPTGAVVSAADTTPSRWSAGPQTALPGGGVSVIYSGNLPVIATGSGSVLGYATVTGNFTTVATSGGAPSSLLFSVTVRAWPWTSSSDSVGLALSVWPIHPGAEELTATPASGSSTGSVVCHSLPNATALEVLSWTNTVQAQNPSSSAVSLAGSSSVTSGTNFTSVAVSVGGGGASFQSLKYSSVVGLVTGGKLLGVPVTTLLIAGAAAVGVTALAALGLRQARRRPWSLAEGFSP